MTDISITNDRISMALGDIIKKEKKQRQSVKTKRTAKTAASTTVRKAQKSQREAAINQRRGIIPTKKPRNVNASIKAKSLTNKARLHRPARRVPLTTTKLRKRINQSTARVDNPHETLKITVENNRRPTANAAQSRKSRPKTPLRQAPQRTREERRAGLAIQVRNAASERRNARFAAARGLSNNTNNNNNNNNSRNNGNNGGSRVLRLPRPNQRHQNTGSRLRLGSARAVTNARSTNANVRLNARNNTRRNNNTNSVGFSFDGSKVSNNRNNGGQSYEDTYANFRTNRRNTNPNNNNNSNRNTNNSNRNNNPNTNRNNNNRNNNNRNNNNRNNNRSNNNNNRNRQSTGSLNALFSQGGGSRRGRQ